MNRSIARWAVTAIASVATVAGGLAATPANAATVAVVGATTVAASNSPKPFSWTTPVVPAASVAVANTVTATTAKTVLTLKNSSAPTSYAFKLNLPVGTSIVSDNAGGYFLATTDENGDAMPYADISAPWAKDATGKSLPTSYTLSGTTLVQTVNTKGATFPVTADPKASSGWFFMTVQFNKLETADIAGGSAAGTFCAPLAKIPEVGWIFASGCAAAVGVAVIEANRAKNRGKCLKVTILTTPYVTGAWWPNMYKGGHCK